MHDPRIALALRIAEARLDTPPTMASLAQAVGLSKFHFLRLFQAQTGESVQNFIWRIRLDDAARRLRFTDEPVISLALSVGYGSQSTFTRAFTARFGVAPADFRRRTATANLDRHRDDGPGGPRVPVRIGMYGAGSGPGLVRRFFGVQTAPLSHRTALLEHLPEALRALDGLTYLTMLRDDPRITPRARVRVDCGFLHPALTGAAADPFWAAHGLEAIRLPAGPCAILPTGPGDAFARFESWLGSQTRYVIRSGIHVLQRHALPLDAAGRPEAHEAGQLIVPLDDRTGSGL